MIRSLTSAAACMNGELHGEDRDFEGVSTDTRTLSAGQLFFALQGPNFDGHDYVGEAKQVGAAAAVVSKLVNDDITQITVTDAKHALGRFGRAWRRNHDVRVVGVTGSNGKTTLKELIAVCLRTKAETLATKGNLNNDIGMPLMLSQITSEHQFAVLEMGANHKGEIAYLTSLANPDVVVITNAGAAHLEGFGSIEGVAKAKGEILESSDRPSVAILNADDDHFSYWTSLVSDVEVLSFGFDARADVRATDIKVGADGSSFQLHAPGGSIDVLLPLVGQHNVRNACAAAAVALVLDVDLGSIKAALEGTTAVDGRLQPLPGINGCALYDDSYNANPLSVIAAADFLASLAGVSWLVLGDMKELGSEEAALHREVGVAVRSAGVDRLFTLGNLAKHCAAGFGKGATSFESIDELNSAMRSAERGTNVLVKGSRSMQMERVVAGLRLASDEDA